jgi:hypothetical protein
VTDLVRKGTRLKVVARGEVSLLTHWQAPFTDGFKIVPEIGTVLVAESDQREGFPGFSCLPEDYASFEAAHIPLETRNRAKYDGFSLVVQASDIGRSLERLA